MAAISTTITLNPEHVAKIQNCVSEGRYSSVDEAVEQLLSQVLEEDEIVLYALSAKARIQEAIDSSLRGDAVHHEVIEAFMDDWERELQA